MTTEFTVPQVADTVAAVLPDRELVVHRDRRFTYTQHGRRLRMYGQSANLMASAAVYVLRPER